MGPLEVTFEAEKDGYPGDERIEIGGPDGKAFRTDWDGSDPTRFLARIRAVATALRDEGWRGTYRIRHEAGMLQIAPERVVGEEDQSPDTEQPSLFNQDGSEGSGGAPAPSDYCSGESRKLL